MIFFQRYIVRADDDDECSNTHNLFLFKLDTLMCADCWRLGDKDPFPSYHLIQYHCKVGKKRRKRRRRENLGQTFSSSSFFPVNTKKIAALWQHYIWPNSFINSGTVMWQVCLPTFFSFCSLHVYLLAHTYTYVQREPSRPLHYIFTNFLFQNYIKSTHSVVLCSFSSEA